MLGIVHMELRRGKAEAEKDPKGSGYSQKGDTRRVASSGIRSRKCNPEDTGIPLSVDEQASQAARRVHHEREAEKDTKVVVVAVPGCQLPTAF